MKTASIFFSFFIFASLLHAECGQEIRGQVLFLTHRGNINEAISLYLDQYCESNEHDSELLQQLGYAILTQGATSADPEIQLLTIFGAGISKNPLLLSILEEGMHSRVPEHQLAALNFLSSLEEDRANEVIFEALSSPFLIIRLEAALALAEKQYEKVYGQIEALMPKVPPDLKGLFPQLFVLLNDPSASRTLRQLLNDDSESVRVETILQVALHQRDDLIGPIRALATHPDIAQQEACALALGHLRDTESIPRLKQLAQSSHSEIRLSALMSLYRLGYEENLEKIIKEANEDNLFALALLNEIEDERVLSPLIRAVKSKDVNIRLNATYALLKKRHPSCLTALHEFLFKDPRDFIFLEQRSLGHSLKAWKAIPSALQRVKDPEAVHARSLRFRERLLKMCVELDEDDFLSIARKVFQKREDDLVPLLVDLLSNHNSSDALKMLKEEQQKAGAPFVRYYCTLALYRLKEEGPYESQLLRWIDQEKGCALIRFRKMLPRGLDQETPFSPLTPEEKSHLLVECYEALASKQNSVGIFTLLKAIKEGHPKNKYALAGLLLRTIE